MDEMLARLLAEPAVRATLETAVRFERPTVAILVMLVLACGWFYVVMNEAKP